MKSPAKWQGTPYICPKTLRPAPLLHLIIHQATLSVGNFRETGHAEPRRLQRCLGWKWMEGGVRLTNYFSLLLFTQNNLEDLCLVNAPPYHLDPLDSRHFCIMLHHFCSVAEVLRTSRPEKSQFNCMNCTIPWAWNPNMEPGTLSMEVIPGSGQMPTVRLWTGFQERNTKGFFVHSSNSTSSMSTLSISTWN